jgi:hypothetical protein
MQTTSRQPMNITESLKMLKDSILVLLRTDTAFRDEVRALLAKDNP